MMSFSTGRLFSDSYGSDLRFSRGESAWAGVNNALRMYAFPGKNVHQESDKATGKLFE